MERISGVVTQQDWSLRRKGEADHARHKEKLKRAIENNLPEIIADESIIMSDGKKIIKVPVRSINEYHFRFDNDGYKATGTGAGGSKKGDIVGKQLKPGQEQGDGGKGKGDAGDQPGDEYYEAEISLAELENILFNDLGLPFLDKTKKPDFTVEQIKFNQIRRHGHFSNLDRRRTILNAMKRNSMHGKPGITPIAKEDLRFKTWSKIMVPKSNALILAMMDVSGSMGTFEKFIARSFFFWMVRFLRTKYTNVEIVFIAHHTEAKVVSEEQFFTRGESGGTCVSSAYELALELIKKRYSPKDYNIYAFHFSDGDNFSYDNDKAVAAMKKLCEQCNAVGYGEIKDWFSGSYTTLFKIFEDHFHSLPNFTQILIKDKKEVYDALKHFFRSSYDVGAEAHSAAKLSS